ncbi:MAG: choice-of-anchor D domain-containing protein, partial [Bacteroidota bacterium]
MLHRLHLKISLAITALAVLVLFPSLGRGQTTVFTDDFSTNSNAAWTTSGAIGASSWSVTRSGADWGARRNTSPLQLEQTNDVGATANANGWVYSAVPLSTFSSPYTATLNANAGLVTWTFNFRTNRTSALAGFSSTTAYGMAMVLVSTSNTPNTSGSGYAVVMGGGTANNIALISFNNGLQGTRTTIIGYGNTPTNLTDYISVRATYNPTGNNWELYSRDDGSSAFADPTTGTLTQIGTTTANSTYTGTAMSYLGTYWQGSTSANQTSFYDNVKVTVLPAFSSSSDIIANTSFVYPANIAYSGYQGTAPLTTGTSVEVAQFDIRDGGATLSDPDGLPTILTAITFNVANSSSIRRIALFDGTSNLAEVAGGATASFSGLTLTAPDNSSKTFSVRVSFNSTVTDNQQFSFTVNSATASLSGSGFAAANAGGAVTSTSGDNNRIEVTATNLVFNVNPTTVSINAVMNPSPTIDAIDGLLNKDLDFTASVGLSTTGTFGGTATTSVNAVSGTATFSNLLFSVPGTGITIAGSATGLSPTGNSPAFDVTNPLPKINLKQNTTSIVSGGSYDYGSLVSGNSSSPITFTIENLGSAVLNLTGTPIIAISGTNASEFTIDQTATTSTVAAGGTTTFIITCSPVSAGGKTAQVSIANNDATPGANPYILNLTCTSTTSALSDIVNTSGYSYSSNIAYAGYQGSTTLTTGTSVGVTGLTIRDGAGTPDGDNLGTTLTAISFSTGGSTAIRTAALFDGSTNVAEVAVNGATTIPFTGLSLTAPDNGTKDFELRVTFQGTVTDKQQITFTITSATASATGSGFATANAGGAASAVTGDINRIAVTATQLQFAQQPSNTVAGAVMFPSVTVKGIDALGNTDLDFTANIDITSSGSLSSSPQTVAAVAGIATFSAITHTATGTGFVLTAASAGFTGIPSNAFNITVQTAGTLIFEDNFSYNTILTSNGYIASSGTNTNNLTAGATGLSYTDYGSSGIGYALAVANTGQDDYKT